MADTDLSAAMIPGIFALGFAVWGYIASEERRQLRRLFRGKTMRVADAPDQGKVRFEGVVVASELGTIPSRVGEPVVWSRLVSEDSPVPLALRVHPLRNMEVPATPNVTIRPFFVDDGSGVLARIVPEAANQGFKLGEIVRLEPTRRMDSTEEIIAPGDRVFVCGTVTRKEAPEDYRASAARVLELSGGPGRELLVTNLDKLPVRVLGEIAFYGRSLLTVIFVGLTLLVIVDALR